MELREGIALALLVLLALYGCAQAIRRLCLWLVRCRRVREYRVAVPDGAMAMEPLFRCLQARAVWENGETTYVLVPEPDAEALALAELLARETPCVRPVTPKKLYRTLVDMATGETENCGKEPKSLGGAGEKHD